MAVTVLAAVACGLTGSMAADEATTSGTSSIEGKITSGSKKTPAAGATVLVYHLATGTIYRSQPTDEKGRFEVPGLPHGYYDIAVEGSGGLYVANQVVNVPPDGRAVSNFNLVPTAPGQEGPRDFPGSDQPPQGIASFFKKSKKKGIAMWTGGTAAAIALGFALASDSGDDPPPPVVSPSSP